MSLVLPKKRLDELYRELIHKEKIKDKSDIATTFDRDKSYVTQIFNGHKPMSDGFAISLSIHYGVNRDWLTAGTGDIFSRAPYTENNPESIREKHPNKKGGNTVENMANNSNFIGSITAVDLNQTDYSGVGMPNQNDDVITALMNADRRYTMTDNSLGPVFPEGTILALKLKEDGIMREGKIYVLETNSEMYVGHIWDAGENWECVAENNEEVYGVKHTKAGKLIYPDFKILKTKVERYYNIVAIGRLVNGMMYTPPLNLCPNSPVSESLNGATRLNVLPLSALCISIWSASISTILIRLPSSRLGSIFSCVMG